ncbi:MAG: hypothetical protein AAF629_13890 [Chloroflexota bacterium]
MVEELGLDVVAPEGVDLGPSGAAVIDIEALADTQTDTIFTVQFSEGETDHPAEPIIASLGVPIVRGVLEIGRPYAGPFSEVFYQEQFQSGLLAVYGDSVEATASCDGCEVGFRHIEHDHIVAGVDPAEVSPNPFQ